MYEDRFLHIFSNITFYKWLTHSKFDCCMLTVRKLQLFFLNRLKLIKGYYYIGTCLKCQSTKRCYVQLIEHFCGPL